MGAWQKQVLSFQAAWPLASYVALEGFILMACIEENDFMFSLQTKKSAFQLNCKLHDILMALHIKSDFCNLSRVGLFSRKEMSWKTLCVSYCF